MPHGGPHKHPLVEWWESQSGRALPRTGQEKGVYSLGTDYRNPTLGESARRARQAGITALSFMDVPGTLMDAYDTGRYLKEGKRGQAGIAGLAALVPFVPQRGIASLWKKLVGTKYEPDARLAKETFNRDASVLGRQRAMELAEKDRRIMMEYKGVEDVPGYIQKVVRGIGGLVDRGSEGPAALWRQASKHPDYESYENLKSMDLEEKLLRDDIVEAKAPTAYRADMFGREWTTNPGRAHKSPLGDSRPDERKLLLPNDRTLDLDKPLREQPELAMRLAPSVREAKEGGRVLEISLAKARDAALAAGDTPEEFMKVVDKAMGGKGYADIWMRRRGIVGARKTLEDGTTKFIMFEQFNIRPSGGGG